MHTMRDSKAAATSGYFRADESPSPQPMQPTAGDVSARLWCGLFHSTLAHATLAQHRQALLRKLFDAVNVARQSVILGVDIVAFVQRYRRDVGGDDEALFKLCAVLAHPQGLRAALSRSGRVART